MQAAEESRSVLRASVSVRAPVKCLMCEGEPSHEVMRSWGRLRRRETTARAERERTSDPWETSDIPAHVMKIKGSPGYGINRLVSLQVINEIKAVTWWPLLFFKYILFSVLWSLDFWTPEHQQQLESFWKTNNNFYKSGHFSDSELLSLFLLSIYGQHFLLWILFCDDRRLVSLITLNITQAELFLIFK